MSDTTSTGSSKAGKSDKTTTKSTSDSSTGPKSTTSNTAATDRSAKERAAAGHSISYFSSISTDEYRAGWDSIFGRKNNANPKAPTMIALDMADLDDKLRAALRQAFANKAAALGLDIDSLETSSTADWHLECTYTPRRDS